MYTAFVLEVTVINGRYTATDTAPVPPPLTTKISELVTHILVSGSQYLTLAVRLWSCGRAPKIGIERSRDRIAAMATVHRGQLSFPSFLGRSV